MYVAFACCVMLSCVKLCVLSVLLSGVLDLVIIYARNVLGWLETRLAKMTLNYI